MFYHHSASSAVACRKRSLPRSSRLLPPPSHRHRPTPVRRVRPPATRSRVVRNKGPPLRPRCESNRRYGREKAQANRIGVGGTKATCATTHRELQKRNQRTPAQERMLDNVDAPTRLRRAQALVFVAFGDGAKRDNQNRAQFVRLLLVRG